MLWLAIIRIFPSDLYLYIPSSRAVCQGESGSTRWFTRQEMCWVMGLLFRPAILYFFSSFHGPWATKHVRPAEEDILECKGHDKTQQFCISQVTKTISTKTCGANLWKWWQENVIRPGWVKQKWECQTGAGDSTGSWLGSNEQSIEPEQSEAIGIGSWKAITAAALKHSVPRSTLKFISRPSIISYSGLLFFCGCVN